MSEKSRVEIEEAWDGDRFVGWRMTCLPTDGGPILVYADPGATPGFRCGTHFVAPIDRTITYRLCVLLVPPQKAHA